MYYGGFEILNKTIRNGYWDFFDVSVAQSRFPFVSQNSQDVIIAQPDGNLTFKLFIVACMTEAMRKLDIKA